MRSTFKLQIALITLILGLTAFIFLKGKDNPEVLTKKERKVEGSAMKSGNTTASASSQSFDIQEYQNKALKNLPDSLNKEYQSLRGKLDSKKPDSSALKKMSAFWARQNKYLLAANYQKELAKAVSNAHHWYQTAEYYQKAQKSTKDTAFRSFAVNQAIKGYQNALDIKPDFLDAKAGLALAYIEGKRQVMKGVGLLKEIVQVEPNHRQALFYLGILSIRSGQLEKALERFKKLVSIQPENAFNHFYLGIVHNRLGNKEQAINAFTTYRNLVKQPRLKEQATKRIKQLKNS